LGNWKKWSGRFQFLLKKKGYFANHIACSYYSFLIKTIMNIQDKIDIIKKTKCNNAKEFLECLSLLTILRMVFTLGDFYYLKMVGGLQ